MRKLVAISALVLSTLVIAGNVLGVRALSQIGDDDQDRFADEPMTCAYEPRGKPLATDHGVVSTFYADCMAADTIGFGGDNREDMYFCAILSQRAPADGTLAKLPEGQVLARSEAAITLAERDGVLHLATREGRLLERIEALDGVPLVFDANPP